MSNIESPDEEIARLSAEVTRLQARLESGSTASPVAPPARSSGRGRAFFAVLLITFGTLLAPVAVVAAWTKAEVTNTDRFVATVAPLAHDPAFQAFLVDEIVAAVEENVDLEAIATDLFDGISALGLPPRAEDALQLLKQPAVEGVRSLVRSAAERLIESDAFAQAWDQTLRISHAQLLAALQGDTSGAVVISEQGELGIQVGPIIDAIKVQLVAQGFALAERIPEIDRTIPIAQSESFVRARTAYQLLDILGFVLPWVSILLIAAGVFTARKKARALIWAGLALALSMVILAAGASIGRIFFVNAVSPQYMPSAAAGSTYDALVPLVYATALSVGLAGVTVAVVAYLAGPFRGAIMVRGLTVDTARRIRAAAEVRGATTGKFGSWVYRARRYLRIAVALVAAAVVLLVRPLTPAIILWTAFGALVVILLIEILQRPPAETALPPAESGVVPAPMGRDPHGL